jgi:hypothetical protein
MTDITSELAYLRAMHAEATRRRMNLIANSIALDIADLVRAQEVLETIQQARAAA